MKILIRHEHNASAYIYSGIANAFKMSQFIKSIIKNSKC